MPTGQATWSRVVGDAHGAGDVEQGGGRCPRGVDGGQGSAGEPRGKVVGATRGAGTRAGRWVMPVEPGCGTRGCSWSQCTGQRDR